MKKLALLFLNILLVQPLHADTGYSLWLRYTTVKDPRLLAYYRVYALWFHHVSWEHRMKSGRTLWDELCSRYYAGVDSVRTMQKTWASTKPHIDSERFEQVSMLLSIQEKEAVWWRNACLLYFQTFSGKPIPKKYKQPDKSL